MRVGQQAPTTKRNALSVLPMALPPRVAAHRLWPAQARSSTSSTASPLIVATALDPYLTMMRKPPLVQTEGPAPEADDAESDRSIDSDQVAFRGLQTCWQGF